jgi:hypothetical protein
MSNYVLDGAVTWDAAQDAARDAAWDAAWDAARDALRLVTAQLRDSILSSGGDPCLSLTTASSLTA